jgi:ferric-dicitrate binding protein FerR (iron transport regulator)/TolA-binding protein
VTRHPRTPERPRPARIASEDPDEQEVARYAALLPDPKPDDVLVERVWRKMQHREPRRASWVSSATAVTALMVLSVAGTALWFRPHGVRVDADRRAEVLLSQGGVFLSAPGLRWTPAQPGDAVAAGGTLRSDPAGISLVGVPAVAALLVGRSADLAVQSVAPSTVLLLQRGEVAARVIKRPADHPFSIRAGDFTVTVVGTIFSVRNDDGVVEVRVTEGAVAVEGRGGHWRVDAGHRWSSADSDQSPAGQVAPQQAMLLLAATSMPPSKELPGLFAELSRSEQAPPPAAPAPSPGHSASEGHLEPAVRPAVIPLGAGVPPEVPPGETSHERRLVATPTPTANSTATPTPIPTPTASPAATSTTTAIPAPIPTATGIQSGPLTPALSPAGERESAAAPPPLVLPSAPPSRDYVAEALELERHGDLRGAEESLKRALASPDARHDLALYQLALLRQRRLNDPEGALQALDRYRELYPRGSLRQEVDLSVVEVDHTLGRTEAALAESTAFLTRYPQSERADEVRLLRGDILRQRGDCAKASAEYRAVSGGPSLDDALYYWAYCQRQLGANASATEALRRYLARFPAGRHAGAAREALGQ